MKRWKKFEVDAIGVPQAIPVDVLIEFIFDDTDPNDTPEVGYLVRTKHGHEIRMIRHRRVTLPKWWRVCGNPEEVAEIEKSVFDSYLNALVESTSKLISA